MGVAGEIVLVANPGSASRKYAVFDGARERASLHFEYDDGRVACTIVANDEQRRAQVPFENVADAAAHVLEMLRSNDVLGEGEMPTRIGLRVVAPSGFFLSDHLVDDDVVGRLEALLPRAPLHIRATLDELRLLRDSFPTVPVVGVSDSAFHLGKPEYAWNYGLPLHDADRLEVKRFGYHGLSAASVVSQLHEAGEQHEKVVVVHLGSGASVTAVQGGASIDNTMGYSPLEGLVMATRSGSLDVTAALALKEALSLDDAGLDAYLNEHSGLRGLGGSDDIRELLRREENGDHYAWLALETYAYNVRKAIGQMVAALGGVDALVFTGTVGERSAPVRQRVMRGLEYLHLSLDEAANAACPAPHKLLRLQRGYAKPLFVAPANEAAEIARRSIGVAV